MIEAAVAEPLEAQEPPEIHEAGRADVALLVASRADGGVAHARFARPAAASCGPGTCSW